MEEKYLVDICNPKQWKTIPKSELIEDGEFPVYGANGIIGRYNKYNHEKPTVLITCRGATCGNIHITVPKSYINGNAMSLDDLNESKCKKEYLYYFLKYYDLSKIISGTAQPQITINGLKKVKVKLYSIQKQESIVDELNKINKVISLKKSQLEELSGFIKSQFVEMFGNPIINDKKFEFKQIGEVTKIVTGTTPDTKDVENWNGGINWITPAEIKEDTLYIYETERKITEKGQKSKSLTLMPKGTVIFSTRAPIGKTAIAGIEMCCNQGFKNCICSININNIYLYYVLKNNTIYFNNLGTGATFKELSKRVFEKVKIAVPPITLQNQFSEIVKQIDKQKFESMIQLKMMEKIYNIINDRRRYV